MKVTEIFIYPIKSCQGISLTHARITPKGLKNFYETAFYDRQFMLVDERGKFLTQRQYPQLATIQVEISEEKLYLRCENNHISDFELTPSIDKELVNVNVWRDYTIAIDQGKEVAKWFKEALKIDISCRLVQQSDDYIRSINPNYSIKENQPVSFADGFPFLLTNTASLEELNQRLTNKYPEEKPHFFMNCFRPNIVVNTEFPFIEDTWKKIQIGEIKFDVVKPCSRCIVTTTDQKTGTINPLKEPLLTLSTFRNTFDGIMFGQNLIAVDEGIIKIGDKLTIK
ncbi:MAG: MOSC domain-containing protein [Cyanobacteria bacterium]|nr:MOSC domain-containing protein [Cyanobacteria bacterium CG_2015-16_32_12]NCO77311.1 MOSC domain-containing protein [Cyanobacteria bacterium CG_2015-22_32_23]NCQ05608.1 MOSC domain-containing protein [Cyanobacteria bacterium CG_2015-09_32_10]NCQ41418.1 MOSC domain-containing protein [Cyanobacteria bacterium CG_2015-04_32_10]NCS86150.1 MOSC domain-containing protein [Cyanobacteria bacterium CG_2015-02_32_10]